MSKEGGEMLCVPAAERDKEWVSGSVRFREDASYPADYCFTHDAFQEQS